MEYCVGKDHEVTSRLRVKVLCDRFVMSALVHHIWCLCCVFAIPLKDNVSWPDQLDFCLAPKIQTLSETITVTTLSLYVI